MPLHACFLGQVTWSYQFSSKSDLPCPNDKPKRDFSGQILKKINKQACKCVLLISQNWPPPVEVKGLPSTCRGQRSNLTGNLTPKSRESDQHKSHIAIPHCCLQSGVSLLMYLYGEEMSYTCTLSMYFVTVCFTWLYPSIQASTATPHLSLQSGVSFPIGCICMGGNVIHCQCICDRQSVV